MCCAHLCEGGRRGEGGRGGCSVFGYVHKLVRKKHCTCDTRYGSAVDAQPCAHTYINSCQLLPDPMGRGHSASSRPAPSLPPPHTHFLACIHTHTLSYNLVPTFSSISVMDRCILTHTETASIFSQEAFSTFRNSTSKIAAGFREIKRERENKNKYFATLVRIL